MGELEGISKRDIACWELWEGYQSVTWGIMIMLLCVCM